MSGSIYSACIGPQSSCQNHSEEGVVCVRARALECVSVCLCACVRAAARERRGAWKGAELLEASRSTASLQRRSTWHLRLSEDTFMPARWERCSSRAPASPAACLCHFSKHGMQFVQPAEAGGAVQTTLRSLSGNALPLSLWEWPGSHLAERSSWERNWGFLHVCVCVYVRNETAFLTFLCFLWSLLGDFLDSGPWVPVFEYLNRCWGS